MRHPLARALAHVGLDSTDVAARLGVDPKTVQRWCAGRVPYPRHRAALADLTGWKVHELWPAAAPAPPPEAALDEVRLTYPHRSAVPLDAWYRLFERASQDIGILVYSGLFLVEDAQILPLLRDKARAGVRVRIALGDAGGQQIARRGGEEGIEEAMSARIRKALILYRPLADQPGVELRLHDTILYNSIYRADDELLVNPHLYGVPAPRAPVLHLVRASDKGMAGTYLDSFERVWESARPID
jgi:DNA-binding transcriptional regulator YdaS (Cro superfamily)